MGEIDKCQRLKDGVEAEILLQQINFIKGNPIRLSIYTKTDAMACFTKKITLTE